MIPIKDHLIEYRIEILENLEIFHAILIITSLKKLIFSDYKDKDLYRLFPNDLMDFVLDLEKKYKKWFICQDYPLIG